jgi:hypothetical protein
MPANDAQSFRYALFDFSTPRQESIISNWANAEKLSKKDRAKLNQRLDRLKQIDFELAIGSRLLNGPVKKEIYKLIAHGQVMMRPMLCRGPFDKDKEYTLLLGAIERNFKLEPSTCLSDATTNRDILVKDKSRRIDHVRL